MSKEIFLYSGDNKYQAYVELADSADRFGCPDHSLFKLIENRNDDKLYLIAEARDGLLETEKDKRIAELKQDLEFTTKTANELIEIKHKLEQDRDTWKRACELASETLKQVMGKPLWIGGNIPTPEVKDSDYFYQQAKES